MPVSAQAPWPHRLDMPSSLHQKLSNTTLRALLGRKSKSEDTQDPSAPEDGKFASAPPEVTLPSVPYLDVPSLTSDNEMPALTLPAKVDKIDTFNNNNYHSQYGAMPDPLIVEAAQDHPSNGPTYTGQHDFSPVPTVVMSPIPLSPSISTSTIATTLSTSTIATPSTRPSTPAIQPSTPIIRPSSPPIRLSTPTIRPPTPSTQDRLMSLQSDGILGKIDQGPKATKSEKKLNKLGMLAYFSICPYLKPHQCVHLADDSVAAKGDPQNLLNVGLSAVKSMMDTSGAMNALEAGMSAFGDGLPTLMKVLDEVASIHPAAKG